MIPNPVFSCPKSSRDVSAPDTLSFLSMLTPYLSSSSSSSSSSVLFPFCLSLFATILSSSSSPSCLLSSSQKETPRPIKNTITNQGTEWQLFPRRGLQGYEIRWHSMSVYCQHCMKNQITRPGDIRFRRRRGTDEERPRHNGMIYDVNYPLFRSFLSQKGGFSDKRKMEEQKPKEQRPKASENKPVMAE